MNIESTVKNAELSERLDRLRPEELPDFLRAHANELLYSPRPFAAYMRTKINVKRSVKNSTERFASLSSR